MHKYLIIAVMGLGFLAPLARADYLDRAEYELNRVYWRVFYSLDRPNQLRLKASELDWINWKDNLSRPDRYDAVKARIVWLENL